MKTNIIAQMLQDAGLGVVGQSIFANNMPRGVKVGLLVLDNLLGTPLDEDLPGFKKSDFRVIVRDIDDERALATARQVMDALNIHRGTYYGLVFQRMRPYTDPIAYPIPDSENLEVSVNMWACYVDQA